MTSKGHPDDSLMTDERFLQAIQLFNQQDWYAAHDAFEELWHESLGEERSLLQGIIQIAVAEHHLRGGNQRGALLLMAEGLNHLQSSLQHDLGLDLTSLEAIVRKRLAGLQTGHTLADIPAPHLLRGEPDKD